MQPGPEVIATPPFASRPSVPQALNTRAAACLAQGDARGALADCTAALRLNPLYAQAYVNRASALHELGNFAAAVLDCDAAIQLDPRCAEAYNNRAAARLPLRAFTKALADCDEALRLKPDLWRTYINRANARYHLGVAGASEDYARAFAFDPAGAAKAAVDMLAFQVRNDAEGAMADCDRHLQENPRDAISLGRRGYNLLLMGREAEGLREIDLANQLAPRARPLRELVVLEIRRRQIGGC
jgi:tetratricopeptide (TPR) repeat protein